MYVIIYVMHDIFISERGDTIEFDVKGWCYYQFQNGLDYKTKSSILRRIP